MGWKFEFMYVAAVNLFFKSKKRWLQSNWWNRKSEISRQISVLPQGGSVKQRFMTRVAHWPLFFSSGLMEGDSLTGCTVQEQSQTHEQGGIPRRPHNTDLGLMQTHEKYQQCLEGRSTGRVVGEEKSKANEEPGQWSQKVKSYCRYTFKHTQYIRNWGVSYFCKMLLFWFPECLFLIERFSWRLFICSQTRKKQRIKNRT